MPETSLSETSSSKPAEPAALAADRRNVAPWPWAELMMLARCGIGALILGLVPLVVYWLTGTRGADALASNGNEVWDGQVWRLGTAWLEHSSWSHVEGNAVCILSFGLWVTLLLRTRAMIASFLVADLTGSMVSCLHDPAVSSVGASAGAMGLIGACAAVTLVQCCRAPLPAGWERAVDRGTAAVLCVGAVYAVFLSQGPRVDSAAHAGGLVGGAMLGAALAWRGPRRVLGGATRA